MNSKIITSFLILSLILVFPLVNAQSESFVLVNQKSVKITIDIEGNVEVVHQIKDSTEPRELIFVKGNVSNLEFIDKLGRTESGEVVKGAEKIVILPNQGELFVKYDLSDALLLKENIWSLNYSYFETTTFTMPKEVNFFFVNERPVVLEETNGFNCHGCQIILEYSIDEPVNHAFVNWENKEYTVEVKTFAEVEKFEFNQPAKKISFKINDSNQFVTTIIPLELLWGPYVVFLDDEKIYFHEYINNGTHAWVNIKPDTVGEVSIIGTTVIPEFPIIAPLAIGFLIILVVPLVRKFNLH